MVQKVMSRNTVHARIETQQCPPSEFFVDDRFMPEVTTGSTVTLWDVRAQHAQFACAAPK